MNTNHNANEQPQWSPVTEFSRAYREQPYDWTGGTKQPFTVAEPQVERPFLSGGLSQAMIIGIAIVAGLFVFLSDTKTFSQGLQPQVVPTSIAVAPTAIPAPTIDRVQQTYDANAAIAAGLQKFNNQVSQSLPEFQGFQLDTPKVQPTSLPISRPTLTPTSLPTPAPVVQARYHTPETMPFSNHRLGDFMVLTDQNNNVTDYAPIHAYFSCENFLANNVRHYKATSEKDMVAWMLFNPNEQQAFLNECNLQPEVQLPEIASILECHRVSKTAYTYHVSNKVDPQGHQQFEIWQRLSKEQKLAFDAQCHGG